MTLEQKRIIGELSRSGLGYRKIAARLGVSANTVKGHIRRNGITPASAPDVPGDLCPQCGADMAKVGRKGQKFCSEPCRRAWWKENRCLSTCRAWYTLVCAGCGKEFQSYGNDARKYCGHNCYIKDRYYREVSV